MNRSLRSVASSGSNNGGFSGRYGRIVLSSSGSCIPSCALTGIIAAKANSLAIFSRNGSSRDLSANWSILLMTRITGLSTGNSFSTSLSRSSKWSASITNITTSTSRILWVTVRFIRLFNRFVCRVWKPGVSTKINWDCSSVRMPLMRWRVVCAFFEVMLTFCPTRLLSSVDLPTLGRPMMAM